MSDEWGSDSWDTPAETSISAPPPPPKNSNKGLFLALGALGVFGVVVGGLIFSGLASKKPVATESPAPTATATPSASVSDAFSENDLYDRPKDMEKYIDEISKATVRVECNQLDGSGGWGTGWGIELDDAAAKYSDTEMPYKVVTNWHVVEGCMETGTLSIFFAASPTVGYPAAVVTIDNSYESGNGYGDLAIIKTAQPVPTLALAKAAPGKANWVMAIGNPADSGGEALTNHVTTGIVSDYLTDKKWIVTTAPINHGNSGGPLLNSRGEVVAINTFGDGRDDANSLAYSLAVSQLCNKVVNCASMTGLTW